jgi:hypothetical protein
MPTTFRSVEDPDADAISLFTAARNGCLYWISYIHKRKLDLSNLKKTHGSTALYQRVIIPQRGRKWTLSQHNK